MDNCQPGRSRDRRDGSLSVPDRRRTSETPARRSRREPRHHRVESPRPSRRAAPRRSAPQPAAPACARHRLDRDDLAAVATSARVSLSVPAAMSTTLPRTQIQPLGQPPSGLVRVVRPGALVDACGQLDAAGGPMDGHGDVLPHDIQRRHSACPRRPPRNANRSFGNAAGNASNPTERASGCLLAPAATDPL